jgi:carbonic anhydrase
MKKINFILALTVLFSGQMYCSAEDITSPKAAFERLMKGNERFMSDALICPDRTSDRRASIAPKQKPYAVILGCSDSRIPPELVFDQGLGDLFVVRVAGNVLGGTEIDSIKYSIFHNGSCLVIVLGHENCGAIDAVLNNQAAGVPAVANLIEKSIGNLKNPTIIEAVKTNVLYQVDQLRKSTDLANLIKQGKLDVIGAYYHFDSGKVEILTDLPTK